MGKDTTIEWAHHTFNPWRGCTKVSDGCKFCYAEAMSKRNPAVLGGWGDSGSRVIAAPSYWRQPFKWNREAEKAGVRRRVFCASLADVFEDREDLLDARRDLFRLIDQCRSLDWLLLTKRPENVMQLIEQGTGRHAHAWLSDCNHVWIGVSVENQETANQRIPILMQIPASVRFLSCEPLLGPLDLTGAAWWDHRSSYDFYPPGFVRRPIDWVIVGGESGPNARPMHPDWVRSLRDQCVEDSIPFFFKQWGEWLPWEHQCAFQYMSQRLEPVTMRWENFEEEGKRFREMDNTLFPVFVERVGKKNAGRFLDGRTWDETP